MIIDGRKLLNELEFRDMFFETPYPKSKVMQWCPMDDEALYKKHMSVNKTAEKIRACGWTDSNIEYRFNNSGFRTDDDFDTISPKPGNIFLGCSVTVGIGINVEDTWGYKVNKQLGGVFYNISNGGGGLETFYRLLKYWAPIIRPKKIFTLGAFSVRREFFKEECPIMLGAWVRGDDLKFLKNYMTSNYEVSINELRTWDAIRMIASDVGAEIYAPSIKAVQEAQYFSKDSWARDLTHQGKEFHNYIASSAFEKIS